MPVCKCCYNKVKDDKEYCSPCDDKHKKLRVDLEVAQHEIFILSSQLAEARAEVERFKHMAEQNSTEMCEWIEKANKARQEAARQIIQYIIDQGIIEVGWNKQQVYEIDRSDIDELRQRYGLEG